MRLSLLFEDESELHDQDIWGDIYLLTKDAIKRGERDPDLERFILDQHPNYAWFYAWGVIKGRWMEAEEVIKSDPGWACNYAKYAIRGRWIEAEEIIKKDPGYAYNYAINILKLNDRDAREWSGYKA